MGQQHSRPPDQSAAEARGPTQALDQDRAGEVPPRDACFSASTHVRGPGAAVPVLCPKDLRTSATAGPKFNAGVFDEITGNPNGSTRSSDYLTPTTIESGATEPKS